MSRTVVITGAASGIGRATRERLTARGERVVGVDLHDADVIADLSTSEGRAAAVAEVVAQAPRIDAVIACAGLSGTSPAIVAVNFFGVADLVTGLLPALAGSAAPRVVVVASSVSLHAADPALEEACLRGDEPAALARAAKLGDEGLGRAVYPGSKAALARWVRRESITPAFAGAGIPLNAVAPGVVLTPMTADLVSDPRMIQAMDQAVPMPLNGHQGPEVVADALIWLASAANSHITGQVVFADGGAEVVHRGAELF